MSAYVLITGSLFRGREQRTSKTGKPFVTAVLFAKGFDDCPWWNLIAFAEEAMAELSRLQVGDTVLCERGCCNGGQGFARIAIFGGVLGFE